MIPGGSVRGERANFTRLVLGCIEAECCNQIFVGKLSPRSTQYTSVHRSFFQTYSFAKILLIRRCTIFRNFAECCQIFLNFDYMLPESRWISSIFPTSKYNFTAVLLPFYFRSGSVLLPVYFRSTSVLLPFYFRSTSLSPPDVRQFPGRLKTPTPCLS